MIARRNEFTYMDDFLGWAWRCQLCGATSCGFKSRSDARKWAEAGDCTDHFPSLTEAEVAAQ